MVARSGIIIIHMLMSHFDTPFGRRPAKLVSERLEYGASATRRWQARAAGFHM
jgi:hypothetical protein